MSPSLPAPCPHRAAWHPGAAPAGGASTQSTQRCGGWKSCDILLLWPQGSCRAPGAGAARADGAAVPTLAALIWARHTGWEGRQREVKLFSRGHPEGRWFKCRHSFPRLRQGWELNFTPNSPLSPAARGQSAVGSPGLTSDGCWRPVWTHTVKNTLRMPLLNSDPRAGAAASPAQGRARRGPLGQSQPGLCRDMAAAAWGLGFPKNQGFPLLGGC